MALVIAPSLSQFGLSAHDTAWTIAELTAATAVVSKVRNKLEELGWIPAVLKAEPYEAKHKA